PSVKHSIPDKLEEIALNVIRARLRDQAHIPRRLQAVLRRCRTGFNFELLQRIGEWHRNISVAGRIVMVGAIEGVIHSGIQSAGDRETRGGERISAAAGGSWCWRGSARK